MTPLQFILLACSLPCAVIPLVAAASDAAYPPPYGLDQSWTVTAPAVDDLVPVRREVYGGGRIIDISHRYHPEMPSWESADGLGNFLWLGASMKNGSIANNSEMKLPAHTGTHVDAPGHVYDHYYDAGFDVDTLDLDVLNATSLNKMKKTAWSCIKSQRNYCYECSTDLGCCASNSSPFSGILPSDCAYPSGHGDGSGQALLVDVPRDKNITAEVMKSLNIPKGVRRVLFRTLNTDRGLMFKKAFDTSYVGFMRDGAQWLVDNTDVKLVGIDYLSVAAFDDLIPSHLVFLEGREIILVEGLKLDGVEAGIYSVHCLPLRLVGAEGSPIRCILIK